MPPVPAWNVENKVKVNSMGIFLRHMFDRVRVEVNADYVAAWSEGLCYSYLVFTKPVDSNFRAL